MLIRKRTITFIVILFLSACTNVQNTQMESGISTDVPKEINWEQVKQMILSGDVDTIVQAHERTLLLQRKDGSQFTTVEPELDAYVQVVEQCGSKCSNLHIMTE